MTERLILREPFEAECIQLCNTLKFKSFDDGAIQVYISNGKHRGYFRLYQKEQKELIDFLQRNIK